MSDKEVVIVTGGASGIGAATCRLLAEHGFRPVVADLQDERGGALADELGSRYVHLDVASAESWQEALAEAVASYGAVYGLVSAAGYKSEYLLDGPVDPDLIARTIAVNQTGVTLGLQIVGSHMAQNARGSIVNIASAAAMPPAQSPDIAYASSKWGVRGASRVAARHLAPYGVRVNTVLPGLIQTPMVQKILDDHPGRVESIEGNIPLRRMGQPIDIARAVLFFISELGGYAAGAELVVDGGSLA